MNSNRLITFVRLRSVKHQRDGERFIMCADEKLTASWNFKERCVSSPGVYNVIPAPDLT